MDCGRANELIMKYMDNELDPSNDLKLQEHLCSCDNCREDFSLYTEIMNEFEHLSVVIAAPDGFEEAVMAKIGELEPIDSKVSSRRENIMVAVWSVLSILFGIGFIALLNRQQIMEYLSGDERLSGYISFLQPLVEIVSRFSENFFTVMNTAFTNLSSFASQYSVVLFVVASLLVIGQAAFKNRLEFAKRKGKV